MLQRFGWFRALKVLVTRVCASGETVLFEVRENSEGATDEFGLAVGIGATKKVGLSVAGSVYRAMHT